MYHRILLVALLLVAATSAQQGYSRVKLFHLIPDGQTTVNVTIFIEDTPVKSFTNVPYKAATEWFYLPYGVYTLQMLSYGDTVVNSGFELADPSVLLMAAKPMGMVAVTLADDLDPIDPGKAHLTLYNWVQYLGDADVGVGESFDNLAAGISFSSSSGPSPFTAGSTSISLRGTGDTGAPLASILLTMESQKHYFIVAVGIWDSTPIPELLAFELTDYSVNSRLAFVHGVPSEDLPVNVIANGQLTIFKNINYKNITDYKNIPVGTHTINVEANGKPAITIYTFFNGFSEATLYATSDGLGVYGILLMDDNTPPADGGARVRVLHGAYNAGVDVLAGGNVIIANLLSSLVSDYLPLPAMTYPISVTNAGSKDAIFSIDLPVPAGAVITVAAFGDPTANSAFEDFTLVVVTDAVYGGNGNLRAVHAIAGGPEVNVKVGGSTLFGNVVYKGVSDYLSVEAGLYRVAVNSVDGDTELFVTPIRVDGGAYHTAMAIGFDSYTLYQLRDDSTRPATGNAHLRVVHASATVDDVTIEFGGQPVGVLSFTDTLGYVPVPAGTYVARVVGGQSETLFNGSLALEADTVVSVFAVGKVNNNNTPFTVVGAIDFDYRTPVAPPVAAPVAAPAAPTGSNTPVRTPRANSASVATASAALMALAALL